MLNSFSSLWPFTVWEIDIIGEIRPNALNGHKYIVVAIDYFSRWIKVKSFSTLKTKQMAKFIEKNFICRYRVPHHIVTNNGVQFQAKTAELLQRYGIEHYKSSPYRPQANGAVEAANKNVKRILSKMVKTYKDWSEYLPFALWGYRIMMRTATGQTPFSLVYGSEAVLYIETEIKSLRVMMEAKTPESEWVQERYDHFVSLDEKRMSALFHTQIY